MSRIRLTPFPIRFPRAGTKTDIPPADGSGLTDATSNSGPAVGWVQRGGGRKAQPQSIVSKSQLLRKVETSENIKQNANQFPPSCEQSAIGPFGGRHFLINHNCTPRAR